MPDCGCRIEQSITGPYIDYCRLHAAASLLADAVRATEEIATLARALARGDIEGVASIAQRYAMLYWLPRTIEEIDKEQAVASLSGVAAERRREALRAAGLT